MNTPDATKKQSNKGKNFIGTVVAVNTIKTASVEVQYAKKHPLYKKSIRRTRRFACHNEFTDIVPGDKVEIRQERPISRTKHFSIVRKIT